MLLSLARTRPVVFVLALFVVGFTGFTVYVARQAAAPIPPTGSTNLWPGAGPWATAQLERLTLDEKIAQLFSVRAYSYFTSVDDPEYLRLVDFVERFGIGGFTFFQGEPLAQASLVNDLQGRSRLPLLIAQDMEWGAGMRIEHATTFPRTMALGATRDPDLAYAAGYYTGLEARALGTHQVFAPVADVNNNPHNPIINVRSFGEDPVLVAEMAAAFARGVRDAGAIATAKHFPGHGDTATDSHADLPVLTVDRDRLERLELVPFKRLIQEGIQSIMTGHLAIPALEPDTSLPASLSPRITQELLRRDLGFAGLVVTDALDMSGVTKHYGTGEAAVRALQAGADVLLLSEDPYAARAAIQEAIREGVLSERRIDASVLRVLQAKEWLGLHRERMIDVERVRSRVAASENRAAGHVIALRGLTLLRNEGGVLPITAPHRRILNITLSDSDEPSTGAYFSEQVKAMAPSAEVTTLRLDSRSGAEAFEAALRQAAAADVVLVPAFTYVRAWSGRIALPEQLQRFLDRLIDAGRPVVLVSFGNPYIPVGLARQPDAYVAAYGASEITQRAAAEAIFGRSGFSGKLPITIPNLYAYGDGLTLAPRFPREGFAAEVGMDDARLRQADSLLLRAVEARAFPGAAVAIGRGPVLVRQRGYGYFTFSADRPVGADSPFDLASLTKVIATTTAAMKLYDEGRLDLDAPVVRYLPEFGQHGKDRVLIRHLLSHTSGLIAYRPFHTMGLHTRPAVINAIMAESLQYEPGTEARYSDLGMITLALVIERITGKEFAQYTKEEIFEPLGMYDTGFRPVNTTDSSVVPTEFDRIFRKRLIQGEVHDETAWILGGTAGHAGLFSTAADLARFAYMLVNEGRVGDETFIRAETIRLFTRRVAPGKHTRALGWDTPSDDGSSSSGLYFGPRSFGHTGFTGTSLWIDPDQDLYVILLTNRVHPTRENRGHIQVRARLADIAHLAIRSDAPSLRSPGRDSTGVPAGN